MNLTQERLKELLVYDPDTGIFTSKVDRSTNVKVGDACETLSHYGYLQVYIDGRVYKLHRLAFLYMEGYMPEYEVDHKNGVRVDNRWCNLRHVSKFCNMQNCKKSSNNKSGFSGVSASGDRWVATARAHGKRVYLGRYSTALEAALARLTWEVQCPEWHCDYRGVLSKQIQEEWPQFNLKSIG